MYNFGTVWTVLYDLFITYLYLVLFEKWEKLLLHSSNVHFTYKKKREKEKNVSFTYKIHSCFIVLKINRLKS